MHTHNIEVLTTHPFCLMAPPTFWLRLTTDINYVLRASGIRRQVVIDHVSSAYREPDNNPHGLAQSAGDFPILLCIDARANTGGWCAPDSNGGFGMCIRLRPDANLADEDQYDRFLHVVLHEFGHGFGCGISESYSTNNIPSGGEHPNDFGVNSMDYWRCDYWSARPDWYHDPMRSNMRPYKFSKHNSEVIKYGLWRTPAIERLRTDTIEIQVVTNDNSDIRVRVEWGLKTQGAFGYSDMVLPRGLFRYTFKRNNVENVIRVTASCGDRSTIEYISIFDAEQYLDRTYFIYLPETRYKRASLSADKIPEGLCFRHLWIADNTFLVSRLNGADLMIHNGWPKACTRTVTVPNDELRSGAIFQLLTLKDVDLTKYLPND